MSIKDKIQIYWAEKFFWFRHRMNQKLGVIAFNIKFTNPFKNLFSKLNFKALVILILIYLAFISIQFFLFNRLFTGPDVSQLPKVKNYLSSYIYLHESLASELNNRIDHYRLRCAEFSKRYSVPFHLSWMKALQDRLNKFAAKHDDIKNYFFFNHLGRLLNFTPFNKKYWQHVYTYTPYMMYNIKQFSKTGESFVYFYLQDPSIVSKYSLKKQTFVKRHTFYNMEPFQAQNEFEDSHPGYRHKYLKKDDLFPPFTEDTAQDSKLPYLMFFTPLYNEKGTWIGSAGFTIDIDNIMKDLLSRHRDILSSIVVNEKGLLVYHPLKDHIGEYVGHFSLIRDIIKSNEDLVIQSSKQIFLKKKISPLNWY
ncbi:MAG: cache domain-containing protein, partial [Spirochaetes bacterium]|nr:cache domain-containing protein [Spirochaetota bacterium]